ncbi:MAG: hypothetical protein B7Z64_10685, partial [Acidiphilium sp. 21-68-69]
MTRPPLIQQMLLGGGLLCVLLAGYPAVASAAGTPDLARRVGAQLSDARLAGIRGGFDVTPLLTVDFAYQQVTSVNGTVIATIAVPQIQLTFGGASGPQLASVIAGAAPATPSALPQLPPAAVTSPPPAGPPLLASVAQYGGASIATTLTSGGLATVIANTASNTLIRNQIAVDVGTTGMPALLSTQAHAMMISQAMTDANRPM